MSGACTSTIGVFSSTFQAEFNLSSSGAATCATAYFMAMLLTSPIAGWLIDRYSARWVIGAGAVLASGGFAWVGVSRGSHELFVAYALMGIGAGLSALVPASVVVSRFAGEKLGLMLAIVKAASTLGGMAFPLAVAPLIDASHWRFAALAVASTILAGALPAALLLPGSGHHSRAHRLSASPSGKSALASGGLTSRTVLGFCLLVAAMILTGVASTGSFIAFVPSLTAEGFSLQGASAIFAVNHLLNFVGLLVIGVAADRFGPRLVFFVSVSAAAIGLFALSGGGESLEGKSSVFAFLIFWGLGGVGAYELMPMLFVRRFGTEKLGRIYGFASFLSGVPVAFAPMLTGWMSQISGSYAEPLIMSAGLMILSVPLVAIAVKHGISIAVERRPIDRGRRAGASS